MVLQLQYIHISILIPENITCGQPSPGKSGKYIPLHLCLLLTPSPTRTKRQELLSYLKKKFRTKRLDQYHLWTSKSDHSNLITRKTPNPMTTTSMYIINQRNPQGRTPINQYSYQTNKSNIKYRNYRYF